VAGDSVTVAASGQSAKRLAVAFIQKQGGISEPVSVVFHERPTVEEGGVSGTINHMFPIGEFGDFIWNGTHQLSASMIAHPKPSIPMSLPL
jgi:hypothetical protein